MHSPTGEDETEAFLDLDLSEKTVDPGHQRRGCWGKGVRHMRWVIEILMAVAIFILLTSRPIDGTIIFKKSKSPVPEFPRKVYTFTKDATFLDEHMLFNRTDTFRTLHNWIPLSSESRGYVRFDEKDSYDLPQPYITPIDRYTEGPGYMVTLYHQLHCLSYLVEHLQAGYSGARLTEEVAHHAAHCFDYIRQGIMCAADTTLEGQTEAGPGWGSKHECKDYDAVLKWANEHATMKWRSNMPDEATL